jgi:hypothetical protein
VHAGEKPGQRWAAREKKRSEEKMGHLMAQKSLSLKISFSYYDLTIDSNLFPI